MSGAVSAWMPFYVGDYLGDTQRLTTEQHGAYLLLILDYWRSGPAPDDDEVLRQITKLDARTWKKHRPIVSRMFQITDGEWHHKRIDAELAAAAENAERRSSKARKGAEARWGNAPSNAPSIPQAMPDECAPPSPSPKEEEEVSVANATGAEAPKPADLKAAVFSSGVPLLIGGGSSDGNARAMLGKWRKSFGDGAVLDALAAAQVESASEPISFINRVLETRNGNQSRNHRPGGAPREHAIFAAHRALSGDDFAGMEPATRSG